MPSVIYEIQYDSSNKPASAAGLLLTLTSNPNNDSLFVPAHSIIEKINYTVKLSCSSYSSEKKWYLTQLAIGQYDGSPYADYIIEPMHDHTHTFSGTMTFSQYDVSKFNSTSIAVYIRAETDHNSTTLLESVQIEVVYTPSTPVIGEITDLQINGKSSYKGSGPVTLTWTPPLYSGSFKNDGPHLYVYINDGDTWGEDGNPSPNDAKLSSYTLPDYSVNHIKESGNIATIVVKVYGYDLYNNYIVSESNAVTFEYFQSSELEQSTIQCYINGEWKKCHVLYCDGLFWKQCAAKYFDGNSWKRCFFK